MWGVLNVTPDSFSDGGDFIDPQAAINRARQMVTDGADVVDIGAESTRPGAGRISGDEEISRLRPVVGPLLAAGLRVSIDTMRAHTAREALGWGVGIINDVSGGLADSQMLDVVADSDAHYVLMHWRGPSDQMDALARYSDVVAEVTAELQGRIDQALEAGISASRIMIDPGLGFSKNTDHNWELVRNIEAITALGYPVLVGASRKRFLSGLLPDGHEAKQRDGVSAALSVVLATRGVHALRIHEPRLHREALRVWQMAQPGGAR